MFIGYVLLGIMYAGVGIVAHGGVDGLNAFVVSIARSKYGDEFVELVNEYVTKHRLVFPVGLIIGEAFIWPAEIVYDIYTYFKK